MRGRYIRNLKDQQIWQVVSSSKIWTACLCASGIKTDGKRRNKAEWGEPKTWTISAKDVADSHRSQI